MGWSMSAQRTGRYRWWFRLAAAIVVLAGLTVSALAVADQVRLRKDRAAIAGTDADARMAALQRVCDERDVRAADAVLKLVADAQDRETLDLAAFVAVRLRLASAVDLIRTRADEGPDDDVTARLITYAARVADRDRRLIPWLEAGISTGQPWRRAGSAAGLLDLGQISGGPVLMELTRGETGPTRDFAREELKRFCSLMMEAVGYPLDWPEDWPATVNPPAEFWARLDRFWENVATSRLLNDVLTQRYSFDPDWYELRRLLHVRNKVAPWFE